MLRSMMPEPTLGLNGTCNSALESERKALQMSLHPSEDTWYPGGSIPSQRFRFVAAAHGDSIYIFGGQGALMGH